MHFDDSRAQGVGNPIDVIGLPGMISVPWVSLIPLLAV